MNGNRIQIVRPWNIISGLPVGAGTQYPIEITPQIGDNGQLIAKWLGVQKNWQVIADSITLNGDVIFDFGETFKSKALAQFETSERTLVRELYGIYATGSYPAAGFDSVEFRFSVGAEDADVGEPCAGEVGAAILPWVLVRMDILPPSYVLTSNSESGVLYESAITATFNGHPFPIYQNTDTASDTWTGTITISAPATDGYFEFRDANGLNPVFDKDSGVQLITPAPLT